VPDRVQRPKHKTIVDLRYRQLAEHRRHIGPDRGAPLPPVLVVAPAGFVSGDVLAYALIECWTRLRLCDALLRALGPPRLDRVVASLDDRAAILGELARRRQADVGIAAEAHVACTAGHREAENPTSRAAWCNSQIEIAAI